MWVSMIYIWHRADLSNYLKATLCRIPGGWIPRKDWQISVTTADLNWSVLWEPDEIDGWKRRRSSIMRSHINHHKHVYNITHHQPLGHLSPHHTSLRSKLSHIGEARAPTLIVRDAAGAHVNICVIQLIMINALAETLALSRVTRLLRHIYMYISGTYIDRVTCHLYKHRELRSV